MEDKDKIKTLSQVTAVSAIANGRIFEIDDKISLLEDLKEQLTTISHEAEALCHKLNDDETWHERSVKACFKHVELVSLLEELK